TGPKSGVLELDPIVPAVENTNVARNDLTDIGPEVKHTDSNSEQDHGISNVDTKSPDQSPPELGGDTLSGGSGGNNKQDVVVVNSPDENKTSFFAQPGILAGHRRCRGGSPVRHLGSHVHRIPDEEERRRFLRFRGAQAIARFEFVHEKLQPGILRLREEKRINLVLTNNVNEAIMSRQILGWSATLESINLSLQKQRT
ncbi:hypothetical protein WDU94_004953, partial [Cyamophila willieti]